MKTAAIYNIFDGCEILKHSIDSIKNDIDLFIIVYQTISNYGEYYDPLPEILKSTEGINFETISYYPRHDNGAINEREKRNLGIEVAKKLNCTHFISMDCDEIYENFSEAKKEFTDSGKDGSVCKMMTYFKRPEWRFENPDNYYVPFIHKLNHNTITGVKEYPFYVDPTRRINTSDVIEINTLMHHFSWVRKDIGRKVRNSSAKVNIEKSQLLPDYYSKELEVNPEGFYVKDFYQKIKVVENKFNIYI